MGSLVWGPQILVRALMEEGIHTNFAITGGHMNSFDDYWSLYGNRLIHMRHEASCSFAAEAYSKLTGKIGLCQATVGPGAANLLPGVVQASLSNTPLICILGQQMLFNTDRYAFQHLNGSNIYREVCKWSKFIDDPVTLMYWIRKAALECTAYPPFPMSLVFVLDFIFFSHHCLLGTLVMMYFTLHKLNIRG